MILLLQISFLSSFSIKNTWTLNMIIWKNRNNRELGNLKLKPVYNWEYSSLWNFRGRSWFRCVLGVSTSMITIAPYRLKGNFLIQVRSYLRRKRKCFVKSSSNSALSLIGTPTKRNHNLWVQCFTLPGKIFVLRLSSIILITALN